MVRIKLWDGPTRIIHWALVVLLGVSWWTAETGRLQWHLWSGYSILGLVIFRIAWGFVGSQSARFGSFVRGPAATLAYLKTLGARAPASAIGHNPVGAISVVVILLALAIQVATGLFAVDVDGLDSGPLSYLVSFDTGRLAAKVHEISFTVLQILAAAHVIAVLFYLIYKRSNLIGAMITGGRTAERDPNLKFASWWRIVLVAIVASVLMVWVSKGLRF